MSSAQNYFHLDPFIRLDFVQYVFFLSLSLSHNLEPFSKRRVATQGRKRGKKEKEKESSLLGKAGGLLASLA